MSNVNTILPLVNNSVNAIKAYNRANNRIINMCVGDGLCTRDILALLRLDVQYFNGPNNKFKQVSLGLGYNDLLNALYIYISNSLGYNIALE